MRTSIVREGMRYVILYHVMPEGGSRGSHWDLLLDGGGGLRSWALETEPVAGATVKAKELPAHRRVFLVYEGPLTDGRGTVTRLDAGICELLSAGPAGVELALRGERVQGPIRLTLSATAGAGVELESFA